MTKTYQTIRSDLARRYRDKLKNVHETLDILARWWAKEIIGKTRNTLLTNLSDSLTQEQGYKEAKQAHDAVRHHLEKNRTTSEESLDWSFLQLYKRKVETAEALNKRKVETAKALRQRAEENNIKDSWWNKLSFDPAALSFDGEVVLDNPGGDIARLFSVKDSWIQEIPLLPNVINFQPDKKGLIYGLRPSSVSKLTPGFFVVRLIDTRPDIRPGDNKSGYIVVDTSWRAVTPNFSYISDIWKFKWFFYAEQEISDKTKTAIIYDDTMHALFHLPIKGNSIMKYTIEYCDKQACIQKDGWKYRIFDQTWLIAEWDEEELSTNEHFQRFLSHQQE